MVKMMWLGVRSRDVDVFIDTNDTSVSAEGDLALEYRLFLRIISLLYIFF